MLYMPAFWWHEVQSFQAKGLTKEETSQLTCGEIFSKLKYIHVFVNYCIFQEYLLTLYFHFM